MDRRTFLKAAAFAGLSVATPFPLRLAHADTHRYDGNFWVMVHARGGWDPTSLCDPKGRRSGQEGRPINHYSRGDIGTAGNINYAPLPGMKSFFDKYYQRLTVINGVDTSTNAHAQGRRYMWSGDLEEGHPALPALIAAAHGKTLPMSFISNGGFDATEDLVATTRARNPEIFNSLAQPNKINPEDAPTVHSEAAYDKIKQAVKARQQSSHHDQHLPHVRKAMSQLFTARLGEPEIRRILEYMPTELDDSNNPLKAQAQVALAAYRAGLSVSVNLQLGGFDTHGDHDRRHPDQLKELVEGIDFLMQEAERQQVADRVIVVMGSDFGRTPYYNDGDGKDHWPITSMMMMGPGIPGNTVIGQTTGEVKARKINPQSLDLAEDGLKITPRHIHKALRKLAAVDQHPLGEKFGVDAESLALFNSGG
jgi:uncharacterized protein (DUF1501 family)